MKKTTLCLLLLLLINAGAARAVSACRWPAYENTVRAWGRVTELFTTTQDGKPWVAFVVQSWDLGQVFVRFDCGTAATFLGCTQIASGDSILVSGHNEDRLSCHQDGIDNLAIPNVIWRCNGHVTGTCVQLTDCI